LAVNAAKNAFKSDSEWRKMDASARGKLMYRLSELIDKHKIHLANLESLDNGKPFSDSLLDIDMTVSTFQYYAGFADKIHGKTIPAGIYYYSKKFTKYLFYTKKSLFLIYKFLKSILS